MVPFGEPGPAWSTDAGFPHLLENPGIFVEFSGT